MSPWHWTAAGLLRLRSRYKAGGRTTRRERLVDYGKAVRVTRAARGLAQRELAAKVSIAPAYLSMIEKGRRVPSRDRLERLAAALGISLPLFILLASDEAAFAALSDAQQKAFGLEFLKFVLTPQETSNACDD